MKLPASHVCGTCRFAEASEIHSVWHCECPIDDKLFDSLKKKLPLAIMVATDRYSIDIDSEEPCPTWQKQER